MRSTTILTVMVIAAAWGTFQYANTPRFPEREFGPPPKTATSYWFVPITVMVEQCDLMIQGDVKKVDVSTPASTTQYMFGDGPPTRSTITFRIINSYPPIDEKELVLTGSGTLETGAQYLIPLKRLKDSYQHEWSFGTPGDYRIEQSESGPFVRYFFATFDPIPLEKAWEIIRRVYDETHGAAAPPEEDIKGYKKALQEGTFEEALQALQFLSLYPKLAPTDSELMDAIEVQYARLLADDPGTMGEYGPTWRPSEDSAMAFYAFAHRALDMMVPSASENSANRFVELYLRDISSPSAGVLKDGLEPLLLKLAIKHPGPDRIRRLHELLGRFIVYEGMHGPYGSNVVMVPDYAVMRTLAETPGADIDAIMAEVFADPGRFHVVGPHLENLLKGRDELMQIRAKTLLQDSPDTEARLREDLKRFAEREVNLGTCILLRLRPGDTSVISILLKANPPYSAEIIRWRIPDPAFAPVLFKALGEKNRRPYPLLSALHRCGEAEAALKYARDLLASPIHAQDWREFMSESSARCGAMMFLGEAGEPSDIRLFKQYTKAKRVDALRSMLKRYTQKRKRMTPRSTGLVLAMMR